jgi:hypothetical protein
MLELWEKEVNGIVDWRFGKFVLRLGQLLDRGIDVQDEKHWLEGYG